MYKFCEVPLSCGAAKEKVLWVITKIGLNETKCCYAALLKKEDLAVTVEAKTG